MNQKIFFLFSVVSYFSYCQCVAPIITNFECGMPTQNILGNGITSISNLYQTGINNSINIGQYTDDGTNGWDNLMFDYSTEIDLSSNPHLSFKLYSPSSIQVMVKLEGGAAVEKWSDFSSINTWEELNYDFSNAVNNNNTKVVLFFNAGVQTGTTNDVYYIDDIKWSSTFSIENSRKIYELTSYPNPVYDIIRVESMININSFVIYDIQGKNLISKKNINKKSVEIDISMLNSGTYFLKNILEKEIKTLKIIKR